MLLTLSDHNPDFLTMSGKYQVLVYQAEAFFHMGDYKKAEVSLRAVPLYKINTQAAYCETCKGPLNNDEPSIKASY